MSVAFNFQYLPLEGRLPGRDFEQQTEDVINGIGVRVVALEDAVAQFETDIADAYQTAVAAQATADSAYSLASNVLLRTDSLESALSDITAIPVSDVEGLFN